MSAVAPVGDKGWSSSHADTNTAKVQRFNHHVVPLIDELRRAALRLTRHEADADDLLQATMERAWRGLDSFAEGTNIRAWLHRIMSNTWISTCRKVQRRPVERPLDDAALERFSTPSTEADVLDRESHPELRNAMRALPEAQRTVVYYAFVEGRRYEEIATMLDIPAGTVMSRIFRARRTLKSALAESGVTTSRAARPRAA
jgi:RNA polymerase sigma-70 factor, ECF subfamily